jgi:hypothetical protein
VASWKEIESQEPDFAATVRRLFDAHKHKVLATIRADGSPRVSGIEVNFADGDVWIGSMTGSRKSADLARDPRLALHAMPEDPPEDVSAWSGDAKLSGVAVQVDDPERLRAMGGGEDGGHLYRIDVQEVVFTGLDDPPEHVVVLSWHEGRGLRKMLTG